MTLIERRLFDLFQEVFSYKLGAILPILVKGQAEFLMLILMLHAE